MDSIRVGIIGAGGNTRGRHIPGLQAIEGVEVVCVANRTLASGRKVAEEFGIPRVHGHWRGVIEDAQVDAVCIGTWPYLHAETTCAALEAGKHVLCEARMAMDADQARMMLAAAQESGLVAMLVPAPFGLRADRHIRELVATGWLGQVREIVVRGLSAASMDALAPLSWRQRADLSGMNILALGILNETVQRWFGATASVMAQTALFVSRRRDPESGLMQDVDIPDSVMVLARMTSGAQCLYHLSGHALHGGGMCIQAYGSGGMLHYDLGLDQLLGAQSEGEELREIDVPAERVGSWQVEADFIAAIRGTRPVTMTSFADGVKYMCFTEAVRLSAATGKRIALLEV